MYSCISIAVHDKRKRSVYQGCNVLSVSAYQFGVHIVHLFLIREISVHSRLLLCHGSQTLFDEIKWLPSTILIPELTDPHMLFF